jgi:hypothetical protein
LRLGRYLRLINFYCLYHGNQTSGVDMSSMHIDVFFIGGYQESRMNVLDLRALRVSKIGFHQDGIVHKSRPK